jgi:LuxR family transcriptional regulator, maltose regulon positive regulatory protein
MSETHGTTDTSTTRRHIVSRPRLTGLLDSCGSRIILLTAPAGYGKTTLAREWRPPSPQTAWYRADSAATDVAALALSMSEQLAGVLPGCDARVRARLASGGPTPSASTLARLLADDLREWPSHGWLVIDDYHVVVGSAEAEQFIHDLMEHASIPVLITGRARPSWASARKLLYGEVYEIGRELLAMDTDEARRTLSCDGREPRVGLVALAAGWPAVIGMAATTPMVDVPDLLEGTLYDFFAEEVVHTLDARTQRVLQRLAIAPSVSSRLIESLVGGTDDHAIRDSMRLGLLTIEPEHSYYLHPLFREFLIRKLKSTSTGRALEEAASVTDALLAEQAWDAAFDVISAWRLPQHIETLLLYGVDDLLNSGRLATLREWVRCARDLSVVSPVAEIAEAECQFRAGAPQEAEVLAANAARATTDAGLKQRALALAAQSAQFGDRPSTAAEYAAKARIIAANPDATRRALYTQFLAAIELEDEGLAIQILAEIDKYVDSTDDAIRAETSHLHKAQRFGGLEAALESALPIRSSVDRARDPMIGSSFLNGLAKALHLNAQYRESWDLAAVAYRAAEEAALDFAIPHIVATQTHAAIGLHQIRAARARLPVITEAAAADNHLRGNVAILEAHLNLAARRPDLARAALLNAPSAPDRGTQGEMYAYLALCFAIEGQPDAAREFSDRAIHETHTVEARITVDIARSLIAIDAAEESTSLDTVLTDIARTGVRDPLVVALRSSPVLAAAVASPREPSSAGWRIGYELAHRWVTPFSATVGLGLLTRREGEILSLVAEGLSNREIASRLYISNATVKVHLRHVFEKLGVRNRAEAVARQAAAVATTSDDPISRS